MKFTYVFRALILLGASAMLQGQSNPSVRFHTSLGDIDVVLRPDVAPLTVANFLNYVNTGAYTNSIFHRSVRGFVIQGGGYSAALPAPVAIPQNPPINNEFNLTNARGTIAMALVQSDPNSATNQWFFNLANNALSLDGQNGSFTVFGKIANDAGFTVMDKLAAVPIFNGGSPFDSIPLLNYQTPNPVQLSNFLLVSSIAPILPSPAVTAAGFSSAASYAPNSAAGIAPGELVTIYGQNLGPAQLTTLTLTDSGSLSTSLAGTRVLFNGVPSPVIYTLSSQLSVVAPFGIAGLNTVDVAVEYQGVQTSPITFNVAAANPAIFTLDSSGLGDAAIVRTDGSIVNAASPAQSGDILMLYGEGAGVMSPALSDGAITGTVLPRPLLTTILLIDGQPVTPLYAGGAPGIVNGVLQVNFQVPLLAPGSHLIQLQAGGKTSPAGVNLQTR